MTAADRLVWELQLPGLLTDKDLDHLEERTNIAMSWYFSPDEYVVGYRFLSTRSDESTYIRAVRSAEPGVKFQLMTNAGPEADSRWQPVRDRLRGTIGDLEPETRRRVQLPPIDENMVVAMSQMLGARAHIGYSKRHWDPRMSRYILADLGGQKVIDLRQTLGLVNQAYEFVRALTADGGTVLMVGTRKHTSEAMARMASRAQMPFMASRWPGGMLTNFATIEKRIERLNALRIERLAGWQDVPTKKERLKFEREISRLERTYGGVTDLSRLPDALWVVDPVKEHLAVREANRLGIPVVALADTDANPDLIDYLIPGNATGMESRLLLSSVIVDAVAEGLLSREPNPGIFRTSSGSTPAPAPEPVESFRSDSSTTDEIVRRYEPPRPQTPRRAFEGRDLPVVDVAAAFDALVRELERVRLGEFDLSEVSELISRLIELATILWGGGFADEASTALDKAEDLFRRLVLEGMDGGDTTVRIRALRRMLAEGRPLDGLEDQSGDQ